MYHRRENLRKSASQKTYSLFDELRTEELSCAKKASEISNNALLLMSLPIFHTVVRNQLCYTSREPKDWPLWFNLL